MFSHKFQRNNFKINCLQPILLNLPPGPDDHKARSKQALKYLMPALKGTFGVGVSITVDWWDAAYFGSNSQQRKD